jgi:hypothetical protein
MSQTSSINFPHVFTSIVTLKNQSQFFRPRNGFIDLVGGFKEGLLSFDIKVSADNNAPVKFSIDNQYSDNTDFTNATDWHRHSVYLTGKEQTIRRSLDHIF